MKPTSVLSAFIVATTLIAGPVLAQADNTNSRTAPRFSTWMQDYSKSNNGRISRQAYMDEAGRRWDAMDRNHQGLTTDEINSMYGYGPTHDRVTRGTQTTNPTGTEMKGQSGK
jgi:hypothetical protein